MPLPFHRYVMFLLGEACFITPDTTCPVYQCQQTPNPTVNPSSTPSATPSATPTAGPTYPCFASDDGGYRKECRRCRHLQPQDPVPSSELSHRVLREDWKTWPCYPKGQNQTCALFDAVRDYYLQDCESNSTCEIGQVWGHPIGAWCVGSVVDMENLFSPSYPPLPNNITSDLSGWDTSSTEVMERMFGGQTLFNGNLSQWDTSSVTTMFRMFDSAESFNGNLSQWDTSSVTDMYGMFIVASSFDQDLFWNTSSVTNMVNMFAGASTFNGDLPQWDTSSVTDMNQMFYKATSFNSSSLLSWNVSSVTDMVQMFEGATDFAQNLCPWKDAPAVQTGSVESFRGTWEMFIDSSGQPNDGFGGFNATACD